MNAVHVLHSDAEGRTTESWFIPEDQYAADDFWS
jgi:hypothetical protein